MGARKRIAISEEQNQLAQKMWRENKSKTEIAEALGWPRSTFRFNTHRFDPPLAEREIPPKAGRATPLRPRPATRLTPEFIAAFSEDWNRGDDLETLRVRYEYGETASVVRAAAKFGLKSRTETCTPWKPPELKLLKRRHKEGVKYEIIGKELGRSVASVSSKARELKLRRGYSGRTPIRALEEAVLEALRERGPLLPHQLRDIVFVPMGISLVKMRNTLSKMRRRGSIAYAKKDDGSRWTPFCLPNDQPKANGDADAQQSA